MDLIRNVLGVILLVLILGIALYFLLIALAPNKTERERKAVLIVGSMLTTLILIDLTIVGFVTLWQVIFWMPAAVLGVFVILYPTAPRVMSGVVIVGMCAGYLAKFIG